MYISCEYQLCIYCKAGPSGRPGPSRQKSATPARALRSPGGVQHFHAKHITRPDHSREYAFKALACDLQDIMLDVQITSHWSACDREPTPSGAEQSSDRKTEGWRSGELSQVYFMLEWRLDTCVQMLKPGGLVGFQGDGGNDGPVIDLTSSSPVDDDVVLLSASPPLRSGRKRRRVSLVIEQDPPGPSPSRDKQPPDPQCAVCLESMAEMSCGPCGYASCCSPLYVAWDCIIVVFPVLCFFCKGLQWVQMQGVAHPG